MSCHRWCALFTVFCCVTSAQGQTPIDTVLAAGARVRITATALSPAPLIGTLEGRRADSLLWLREQEERPSSLPLPTVQKLEISQGRHAETWRGGLIGALAGIGAGALIGLAAGNYSCPTTGAECSNPGESAAAGAVLGAVVGGGIGLLIGSSRKSERWQAVSPEQIRAAWRQQQGRTPAIMAVMER
jgi:hypothetical protein